MFGPDASDEAVIDPGTAAMEHLAPGDTLHLVAIPGNSERKGHRTPPSRRSR